MLQNPLKIRKFGYLSFSRFSFSLNVEDFFCMSDCLLIALTLLNRNITIRLTNLWQHIRSNPVLELHGSRKLGAKHQGIESALVNEDYLLGAF